MKIYEVGDKIALNFGEVLEVSGRRTCGSVVRKDNLYSFRGTSLTLSGREIEMAQSAYWREATPKVIALSRRVAP